MSSSGDAWAEVARLHAPREIRLHCEPAGQPGPGEVRLQVTAVGLCGSDRHWYEEGSIGDAGLSRPLVLGHEFAGIILDGARAGERVVADPADPCGACEYCAAGRSNVCPTIRFAGYGTTDGALRTVMPWPERLLHPLPDAISDEEATLLEPLGVALHALELAPLPPGGRAGVYGCGPIGLLLVGLLRAASAAEIVATDRLPERASAAKAMGATTAVVVDGQAAKGDGAGADHAVDVAFEVAGEDAALADAITAVRPAGRVVLIGIPPHDRTSFSAGAARRKGLSLLLCRRMRPEHLLRAIELAADGATRLSSLITHRYPLTEVAQAFAPLVARSGLKVIVNPTRAFE